MNTPRLHLRKRMTITVMLALLGAFVTGCCPGNCPNGGNAPCGGTSSSTGSSSSTGAGGACAADCGSEIVQATKQCIANIKDEAGSPLREAKINGCCRKIAESPDVCPASSECVAECKSSE